MPGAERHTKVLTNVWAHQVFKCLAYVDTMRIMNTKMLVDTQRKLIDLKLFTNSHSFWGNTQLLKIPRVSKWKGQWNKKKLGSWKLICFTVNNYRDAPCMQLLKLYSIQNRHKLWALLKKTICVTYLLSSSPGLLKLSLLCRNRLTFRESSSDVIDRMSSSSIRSSKALVSKAFNWKTNSTSQQNYIQIKHILLLKGFVS